MTSEIEGRWRLEFEGGEPRDPSGNEFVLHDGVLSLARTGEAVGTYRLAMPLLVMNLPMPAIAGEGAWEMTIRLAVLEPEQWSDGLLGLSEATDEQGELIATRPCRLVRLGANG